MVNILISLVKVFMIWDVLKEKNSMEIDLYVMDVSILHSTLIKILDKLSGNLMLHLSMPSKFMVTYELSPTDAKFFKNSPSALTT